MPYSSALFGGAVSTGSFTTLYDVPSGYVAVIRDMAYFAYSGDAQFLQVAVVNPGPSGGTIWYVISPAAVGTVQWQGRAVVESSGSIEAICGSADNQLVISGYLLSSP